MDFLPIVFYPGAVLAPTTIEVYAGYSRRIIALPRLVALVLPVGAYSEIRFTIIQGVQVDVVDFHALWRVDDVAVYANAFSVAYIGRIIGSTVAAIPRYVHDFAEVVCIKDEHLVSAHQTVSDKPVI
jgi:hypothetical protein